MSGPRHSEHYGAFDEWDALESVLDAICPPLGDDDELGEWEEEE